ncbi:hypothetical protein [Dactylosporangium sp. NPDC005555]|uniref:hypothetical protein n=1 Tax=Dactylosporangium sp. NPDC005555 TaxID=3154889 RepID=UPI00339DE56B
MTTVEQPSSTEQPQPEPPEPQPPVAEPAEDPEDTGETDAAEDTEDEVRSLPANMIRSYGILDSDFFGPAAIGAGATSIGAVLNVGAGQARRRFINQPLDGAVVLERIHTYAATSTPDRLVERLASRPVAYLSGPAGSGRFTAALVGLARTHAPDRITQLQLVGDEPIHAFLADRDLLRPEYGHVVELSRTPEPEPSELAQLSNLARAARAAVVFVGPASSGQLVEYHVEHARPDPQEVFLAWLERWLRDQGRCIDACPACEQGCVRSYVEHCRAEHVRHLSANTMTDAVRFAQQFADLVPDDNVAADLLADRATLRGKAMGLLDAAPARDGFHHRRLAQHRRAARLAFAVFNGYPLTRVFEATGALIRRLDEAAGRDPAGPTVLEHSLDELLGDIRASAQGAGTVGAARIAELRQPELVRGLLDVAWHEYDTARQPLLDWLDDLVVTGDARPVAAAAGLLCEYDFDQIRRNLLETWAASKSRSRREAAALACELAVHNSQLAPRVLGCVAGWVGQPGNRRDTAVRTYATNTFRRRYPLDALLVLERAAFDDMQRTSNAIPVGVRGIYTTNGAAVMRRLVRWPESPFANVRSMAGRCLVQLAEVDSNAWPALLRQTDKGELSAADHAGLWPGALLNPATARQAWSVFERWIGLAATDQDLAAVLCDLLSHVLRGGPINVRARFYLRHFWRRSMPGNPLLDTIDDMLEGRHHEH